MRKFMVVGCGGSGGAAVRFLMDELSAQLGEHGVSELPKAWQFLHLDVPTAPESGPGLLKSVRAQGGRYVGLSYPGAKFSDISAGLYSKLREGDALDAVASWWPDPDEVNFPVVDGAGQYRTVGRAMTLATLGERIRPSLEEAWTDLNSPETLTEMKEIEKRVPGVGSVDSKSSPLIFVISSMAGGSGASMVLDVCDTIGSSLVGVQPDHIGLFLFTPDVFAGLGKAAVTGVEGNAAAALAELIAAQTRASEVDPGSGATDPEVKIMQALGFNEAVPDQPFGRVFPVGGSIGDLGAKLGDGEPNTVYRALGRGLGSLMLAGKATESFAQYDLVNQGMSGRREDFGWGEPAHKVAWGCFGYASLNLGRDRYAEYAAQRLARSALDRLATAHQQQGGSGSGVEQVRRLVDARWSSFCTTVGLPTSGESAKSWFVREPLPEKFRKDLSTSIRSELIDSALNTHGQMGDLVEWSRVVENQVGQRASDLKNRVDKAAERWALNWHAELVAALEKEMSQSIGLLGLPYTIGILDRLEGQARLWAEELRNAAVPISLAQLPQSVAGLAAQSGRARGPIQNTDGIRQKFQQEYQKNLERAIVNRCGALAGEMLADMSLGLVARMSDSCTEGLRNVERARVAHPHDTGLAQLQTDDYASWPSDADQAVPERFAHAENEVLLTEAAEFPVLYPAHLAATVGKAIGGAAVEQATREVVTGIWSTVGGKRPPGGLVGCETPWRSGAVQLHPDTGEPIIPRPARYVVTVSPEDILERSREYVRRPDQAFAVYSHESLYSFLSAPDLSEFDRSERERLVAGKLAQTMELARPLIGIHRPTIEQIHGNGSYRRQYKFSPVPFEGLRIRSTVADAMGADQSIDASAVSNFEQAIEGDSPITRISVFGSYPSYFPLAFRSLLEPISAQWAGLSPHMRENFWHWRRARSLPAALPVGRSQRRAIITGWLVGRIVGSIRVPENAGAIGAPPVEVLDPVTGSWLCFSKALVVPRASFRAEADILVALLESMSVAIADAYQSPEAASLQPYTALRRIYDDTHNGPIKPDAPDLPSGARHLAEWIQGATAPAGKSIIGAESELAGPDHRRERLIRWLGDTADQIKYLQSQPIEQPFNSRPLMMDLADDLLWGLQRIRQLIEMAPEDPLLIGGIRL